MDILIFLANLSEGQIEAIMRANGISMDDAYDVHDAEYCETDFHRKSVTYKVRDREPYKKSEVKKVKITLQNDRLIAEVL